LLEFAGKDATKMFDIVIHTINAKNMVQNYDLGYYEKSPFAMYLMDQKKKNRMIKNVQQKEKLLDCFFRFK
jgi:hypothetical protein